MECDTGSLSNFIIDFPKIKLSSKFLKHDIAAKHEKKLEKNIVKSVSPKIISSTRKILKKEEPIPVNRSFVVKTKKIAKLTTEEQIHGDLM